MKCPEIVEDLQRLADEMDKVHKGVNISKVAGSAAGIVGGVLEVVGFGLSFVTFGASLGLTIADVITLTLTVLWSLMPGPYYTSFINNQIVLAVSYMAAPAPQYRQLRPIVDGPTAIALSPVPRPWPASAPTPAPRSASATTFLSDPALGGFGTKFYHLVRSVDQQDGIMDTGVNQDLHLQEENPLTGG